MVLETLQAVPTEQKPKTVEQLVADITADNRINGKDQQAVIELADLYQKEKGVIKQETHDALCSIINESLSQGYEVQNIEDFRVLQKLLSLSLNQNVSLPDYIQKLKPTYGDFSIRLENGNILLYNLSTLRAQIDPKNGTLQEKNFIGAMLSGNVDARNNNNTISGHDFEVLSQMPEAQKLVESIQNDLGEAKLALHNPQATQEDKEIWFSLYQRALETKNQLGNILGPWTLGVLKNQWIFANLDKTFVDVESLLWQEEEAISTISERQLAEASKVSLNNEVHIRYEEHKTEIKKYVKDLQNPTETELNNILRQAQNQANLPLPVLTYAVQSMLSHANFWAHLGKIDGIAGTKYLASVKAYQTANGLTPDGDLWPLTLGQMLSGIPQNDTQIASAK